MIARMPLANHIIACDWARLDQMSTRGSATLDQHLRPAGSPTSPTTASQTQKPARQQPFSVTRALLKSQSQVPLHLPTADHTVRVAARAPPRGAAARGDTRYTY